MRPVETGPYSSRERQLGNGKGRILSNFALAYLTCPA